MTPTQLTLADSVGVRGRFHRSVNIAADWGSGTRREHYLVTPTVRSLTERMLGELSAGGGVRAWSITGPYGSGKSAFALFLTDLLTGSSGSSAPSSRLDAPLPGRPFVPVLVVCRRAPFGPALLSALGSALVAIDAAIAERARALAANGAVADDDVVDVLRAAAEAVGRSGRHGGLVIIVDELGKFLEYAALHPEDDVLLLQTLAETAARSTTPMLLLTILHMAFGDYLRGHDEARRSEWRKVQGRFVDVAFQEPTAEVLRLVGLAIERSLPPQLEHAYVQGAQAAASAAPLADASRRLPLAELLPGCAPLDPITALLLPPLFRSKLAQNERSLFSFLTGLELHGFRDFLRGSGWDGGLAPTYRLDRLYDYVTAALGMAVYSGDQARRWGEIEGALARVAPDAPRMTAPVVKAVGLLSLYGRHVWLKPDEATLTLALGSAAEVAEAIDYLKRASILVYRQYEQAYALWEGSDLDVDDLYAQARQRIEPGSVATRLKRVLALRPIVARAHYIRTGTLRYFTVEVIDGNPQAVAEALAKDTKPADGAVVYVLAGDDRQRGVVLSQACELAEELPTEAGVRLLAFPSPMLGLQEALREVEAWRSVRDDVPALQSDPVARREVRARLQAAQEQLETLCGQAFPLPGRLFRPEVSDWVHKGAVHRPRSAQGFQEWISHLCDATFSAAPVQQNELLNRQQLSSAAAAARRTLLEAMLAHEAEFRLGLSGTPAEVTMYESLLRHGGFHQECDGRWVFGEPAEQWQAVWIAMLAFLATTHAGRRPVQRLYDALRRPPFGLRDGPLPVLLCALLLARRADVALYEDGVFVPDLRVEVVERLQRRPESFEIQQYAFTPEQEAVFRAIARGLDELGCHPTQDATSVLAPVARSLYRLLEALPPYARQTRRALSPEAIALRDALRRARDPYALLLEDVPAAVGGDGADGALGDGLRHAVVELQQAYPRLLDGVEQQLRAAFGLSGTNEQAQEQLRRRALPLHGHAADPGLAGFVREAAQLGQRDWREVLARVVGGGSPATHWRDADAAAFGLRLRQIASDFVRLEELVAEERRAGGGPVLRIGVLNGRVREARAIIAVPPTAEPLVHDWAAQIVGLLDRQGVDGEEGRRLRLAALVEAARRYLDEGEEVAEHGDE